MRPSARRTRAGGRPSSTRRAGRSSRPTCPRRRVWDRQARRRAERRGSAKVWGIDSSDEMVAVARESLPGQIASAVERRTAAVPQRLVRSRHDGARHPPPRANTALAEARRVVGTDGCIAISTFHPEHFESYWLNPYFPSIRAIDEHRFPTPERCERELERQAFRTIRNGCSAPERVWAAMTRSPGFAAGTSRPSTFSRGGDRGRHGAGRAGATRPRGRPAGAARRRRDCL